MRQEIEANVDDQFLGSWLAARSRFGLQSLGLHVAQAASAAGVAAAPKSQHAVEYQGQHFAGASLLTMNWEMTTYIC